MYFAHTVTPGCKRCGDHTIAVFVGCCVLLPDCPALRRHIINDEGNADIVAVVRTFDDLCCSCFERIVESYFRRLPRHNIDKFILLRIVA